MQAYQLMLIMCIITARYMKQEQQRHTRPADLIDPIRLAKNSSTRQRGVSLKQDLRTLKRKRAWSVHGVIMKRSRDNKVAFLWIIHSLSRECFVGNIVSNLIMSYILWFFQTFFFSRIKMLPWYSTHLQPIKIPKSFITNILQMIWKLCYLSLLPKPRGVN